MSITEYYLVDGLEIVDDKTLKLIIRTLSEWEYLNQETREYHVINKIKEYLKYIDSKKYQTIYKDKDFDNFLIEIRFNHYVSIAHLEFLKPLNRELRDSNIKIKVEIAPEKEPGNC